MKAEVISRGVIGEDGKEVEIGAVINVSKERLERSPKLAKPGSTKAQVSEAEKALAERVKQLDAREKDLKEREEAVEAAEKDLAEREEALKQ